jgi:hypothetical protein
MTEWLLIAAFWVFLIWFLLARIRRIVSYVRYIFTGKF